MCHCLQEISLPLHNYQHLVYLIGMVGHLLLVDIYLTSLLDLHTLLLISDDDSYYNLSLVCRIQLLVFGLEHSLYYNLFHRAQSNRIHYHTFVK